MQPQTREVCYQCYRPKSSCMCAHISPIKTRTRFVILMHPKEFKKTKNGTGHFTNLSLENCTLYVGVDFTKHAQINEIISTHRCYVLYPSATSINLNEQKIKNEGQDSVIFLIDSTWPCSRAMLRASPNIDALQKISFTHTKNSSFTFKEQPQSYCLSTMESTLCVLELLNQHQVEHIDTRALEQFLTPFHKMVKYQLACNL